MLTRKLFKHFLQLTALLAAAASLSAAYAAAADVTVESLQLVSEKVAGSGQAKEISLGKVFDKAGMPAEDATVLDDGPGANPSTYPNSYSASSYPNSYSAGSYPNSYSSSSYPNSYSSASYPNSYSSSSYPNSYSSSSYPNSYSGGEQAGPQGIPARMTALPQPALKLEFTTGAIELPKVFANAGLPAEEAGVLENKDDDVAPGSYPAQYTSSSYPSQYTSTSYPSQYTSTSYPSQYTSTSYPSQYTSTSYPSQYTSTSYPSQYTSTSYPSQYTSSSYPSQYTAGGNNGPGGQERLMALPEPQLKLTN